MIPRIRPFARSWRAVELSARNTLRQADRSNGRLRVPQFVAFSYIFHLSRVNHDRCRSRPIHVREVTGPCVLRKASDHFWKDPSRQATGEADCRRKHNLQCGANGRIVAQKSRTAYGIQPYLVYSLQKELLWGLLMPRLSSFASWNIEHFSGNQNRFDRVVTFLNTVGPADAASANGDSPPDVFAVQEVRSSTVVYNEFTSRMPGHQFFITVTPDSPLDILVGVNRNFTAFYEQRTELQSGMPTLRPGALVSLPINGENYSLLFLHLKAFDKPVGWGLRDDMIHHIRRLKRALDNVAGQDANFIAMGDINNVGLNVTFADNDMTEREELTRYDRVFNARNMSLVVKDLNETFWNGPG